MGLSRKTVEQIRDLLQKHPQGLSITDLAKIAGINRNTAGRYLDQLLLSGQVEMHHFGMAKLFRLSERLPISAVLSISSELVLQLDSSLRVIFINDPFLEFAGATSKDIIGKNIEFTMISQIFGDDFSDLLVRFREGVTGTEWWGEITLPERRTVFFCRIVPTVFNEGAKGVSVLFEDISSRKRDEDQIRQSETRLRSIIRVSPIGIGVVHERVFFEVNARLCQITGYTSEELIGQSARMLYRTQEEYDRVGLMKYAMIQDRGTGSVETQWQRKDGELIDVLLRSTPLDPDDLSKGITFTALEITARKRAEEALRESEERLSEVNNAFLSFSPDPVGNITILTGLAGRMLQGTCALYNRLEGGLLCSLGMWNTPPGFKSCDRPEGHICNDIIREGRNTPTIITDLMVSSYADSDPNVRQYQLHSYIGMPVKIGKRFLGSLCVVYGKHYSPTLQEQEILSFLARAISIEDERRTAVQALRESEDRYRNLVEISPDAVFLHREGRIIYVNPAAVSLFGAAVPEEIIGKSVFEFIEPDYRGPVIENIKKDLAGEITPPVELQMHRFDGTPFVVEGRGVKTYFDGKPAVQVSMRDITERKKREDDLKCSQERYRRLLEQSFDAIAIHKEGKVTLVNDATVAILGASSPEEIIGKSIYNFIHPDSQPVVKERLSNLGMRDIMTLPLIKETFVRVDGKLVEVEVMTTSFLDSGIPAVQVVFRKFYNLGTDGGAGHNAGK
jgi:PAS domain S-box-containing protein